MLKKLLVLAAFALLVIGMGCSGSGPTVPSKTSQTPDEYFNQFNLSSPVVGEYNYYDNNGKLLGTGLVGRNDKGLYVIESRGADALFTIDFTGLGIANAMVTYNNPAGTIGSGPNAGLPFYYLNQTVDYDIDIIALMKLGGNNPLGFSGPATVTAEMHYASFDVNGNIVKGGLLPGAPVYTWSGILPAGLTNLNDQFTIVPGTSAGLDVTTVQVKAPFFLGWFDLVFFDGIAGIWDPQ
jgi:hypothetical protein